MGLLAQRLGRKSTGIGYPNVGWQPYPGWYPSTTTGVVVDQEKASTVASWWLARRVLAEDVAKLPLIVYRRNGKAKDRATDHPMYRLLHDAPNPEMTSFIWRETAMGHLVDWGNCYAERQLNGYDQTVALWPLRPDRMTPRWTEAGKREYDYVVRPGTKPVTLEAKRVFHIPGLGFDGLVGYSVLRMARETLGNTLALREYGSNVLRQGARPGVILKHPKTMSTTANQKLRDDWESIYGGFTNAGRTAILEEGMDATVLGLPREDLLFLEGHKWQVTEVARYHRLAPHKLNDLEHATFSNIEEQNIDHTSSAIQSWLTRWEQQANKDLLPEPDLFAEHLMDAALRGRTLERFQAYAIAVDKLAMTPNEWREKENWNPVPWGDEPVRGPNNTVPDAEPMADVEAMPAGATNGRQPVPAQEPMT